MSAFHFFVQEEHVCVCVCPGGGVGPFAVVFDSTSYLKKMIEYKIRLKTAVCVQRGIIVIISFMGSIITCMHAQE